MQIRRRAEDDQHSAFTKRKGLATQRKQMKEQKDEAEKHQRMSEDGASRVEHVLFKLFHIDFDASRHAEEIEEAEEALRAHEAKVDEMSKEMEESDSSRRRTPSRE